MCFNCKFRKTLEQRSNPFVPYADGDCCKVALGYYCNYDYKMRSMECEDWAQVCDFMKMVRQFQFTNFSIQSNRDAMLNTLLALKTEAPFAFDKRYPATDLYVNITCSEYAEHLRQVAQALNFKEREKEVDRKVNPGSANSEISPGKFSADDASSAFHKGVLSLKMLVCKRNEVYGRDEFEAKYGLQWCEGVAPPPPGKPSPPEWGPGNPRPNRNKLGGIMDALKERHLDVEDFDVFQNLNTKNFSCGQQTNRLNNLGRGVDLPTGTERVFVFNTGAYQQCEEGPVNGYIYDTEYGILYGPFDLKDYGRKTNFEPNMKTDCSLNRESDVDQLLKVLSIITTRLEALESRDVESCSE